MSDAHQEGEGGKLRHGLRSRILELKVTLWTLIVPPTVWAAHFIFCYLWVAISCARTGQFPRFPVAFTIGTGVALAIIAGSGAIAWVQSRGPGDPAPHEQGTDVDRLRFIATATFMLAGLSFVAVLFTAVPALLLTDCR